MAKTHTEIRTAASRILEDPNNVIWPTDKLDAIIIDALPEASRLSPRMYKETVLTTADTKEINVSTISNLLEVEYAEWTVDQTTPLRRSVNVYGDILTLDVSTAPDAVEDAYLFCKKVHTLVGNLTDKTGAVNNGSDYAAGDTSIVLDALQASGTIEKGTLVTFAGTNGEYLVSADAAISTNAATIVLDHGLLEAVVDDTVVTFICTTLTPRLDVLFPRLVAAMAKVDWTGDGRTQLMLAIDNLTEAALPLADMSARVTKQIADVALARTESGKILAAILLANTAIDSETARIVAAVAQIASGTTEADKVPTAVTAARTALGNVAARNTQAVADLASGRTETDKGVALITSANASIAKMDGQMELSVNALMEAGTYVNAVSVGLNPEQALMALSGRFNQMAQGYQQESQAYMNQAAADMRLSREYSALAAGELQSAGSKIGEAQGYLAEASGNTSAAATYAQLALSELRAAQEYRQHGIAYLQEAQADAMSSRAALAVGAGELQAATMDLNQAMGTIREATGRLNVARLIQGYQRESERGLSAVQASLRALKGPNQKRTYARGD